VPYREPSGLFTGARESVQSLTMRAASIPAKYTVRNFSPEEPHGRVIDGDVAIDGDRTTQGTPYTWGTPYLSKAEAKQEAQLRKEAALAAQVVYTGTCDMLDLAPACVLELSNRELADVKYGLLVTRMTCSASRKAGYRVEFTAIPSDRQYRHPLETHTWPRIEGVITGTIGATERYVGPYLDEQGRYTSFATSASFNVNAFRKIAMAAKEVISLFAQTSISLLAARGKVRIHAITDGLDIASQKDAYIRSVGGKVIIEAKDELLLKCGGSYISLKPHNLINATPGDYIERAASWNKADPDGTITKAAVPYVTDIADLARHGSRFSG
jgi:hypothetical protein